jgi:hypothetical protein
VLLTGSATTPAATAATTDPNGKRERTATVKTKVRVKRAELIKVVDGRARKAEKDYARERDAYPAKVEAWQAQCVEKLEKALADAKRGKMPQNRYGSVELKFYDKPTKPSEGRALCNLRRMLATLKIGAEETILLSQEDADDYFGPCTL